MNVFLLWLSFGFQWSQRIYQVKFGGEHGFNIMILRMIDCEWWWAWGMQEVWGHSTRRPSEVHRPEEVAVCVNFIMLIILFSQIQIFFGLWKFKFSLSGENKLAHKKLTNNNGRLYVVFPQQKWFPMTLLSLPLHWMTPMSLFFYDYLFIFVFIMHPNDATIFLSWKISLMCFRPCTG